MPPGGLHQDFTALVGAWRLMSFGVTFSDTGERIEPNGANPDGHMVLSQSGRIMFLSGRATVICRKTTPTAQPCSIISLLTPE
jgi:hypothetical protein